MCVPYLLRGPLTDLRQTWWVYVGWPPICPWGVLFRKGQRVTFTFHYTIYAPASRHTAARCLLLALQQSLIRRLLLLHLNGISRWTSQLLLRGSFSKRSMGQRVTFTILYMIADDARLTPPRCKMHTGSTGQWVHGPTGHVHIYYIIYDSRRRKVHATPLHKAHGVWLRHTAAKSTQHLLLAWWVNFLVIVTPDSDAFGARLIFIIHIFLCYA